MTKTSIHTLLTQLDRVELMRKELLEEIQLLPAATIQKVPFEGKWSILEIIEHMVLGEDYVLNGVGTSEKLVPKKRMPYHFFRYFMVMRILGSSFKVKAPSKKMHPISQSSLEDLIKRWEHNHQILRKYIETITKEKLSDAVFFHPISGPLTTQQAMNMLEVHMKRHWKQIREIVKDI